MKLRASEKQVTVNCSVTL